MLNFKWTEEPKVWKPTGDRRDFWGGEHRRDADDCKRELFKVGLKRVWGSPYTLEV